MSALTDTFINVHDLLHPDSVALLSQAHSLVWHASCARTNPSLPPSAATFEFSETHIHVSTVSEILPLWRWR